LCGAVAGAGKTTLLYTLAGLEAAGIGKRWILKGRGSTRAAKSVQARIRNERIAPALGAPSVSATLSPAFFSTVPCEQRLC